MFDAIRRTSCTITDIDVGAYLMLKGAKLEGVTIIARNRASYTFTGKNILALVYEYKQSKRIRFSPKAFCDFRYELKKFSRDTLPA